MCSPTGLQPSCWRGCPIRTLRAQRLHAAPPERFAGLRVLLRPSAPRHPPRTLSSLFSLLLLLRSAKLKSSASLIVQVHGVGTPTPQEWKPVRAVRSCSTWDERLGSDAALPRKEVIQPHLPVRLPCYDFTPITDPTLDACPPAGLAGRLQVWPTFVV